MNKRNTKCIALLLILVLANGSTLSFAATRRDSVKGNRSVLYPLIATKAPGARNAKPTLAARVQAARVLPGQTVTLLPDGRSLLIGGQSANGPQDAIAISDPRTGEPVSLKNRLHHARAWHSATMLPDGSVLIFGGIGNNGSVVKSAEIFDAETQTITPLVIPEIAARAHHTATLLTDGQVLIIGGSSARFDTFGEALLWDFKTRTFRTLPGTLSVPRQKHTATLLYDGNVLIESGVDAEGTAVTTAEFYNTDAGQFIFSNISSAQADQGSPFLAASLPTDGATDVPVDTFVALRFSKSLRVETVNSDALILNGPEGTIETKVVPAENGRLAFVTPKAALLPGVTYTISVAKAAEGDGKTITPAAITFTTKRESDPEDGGGVDWVPDEANLHGNWRSNFKKSEWQSLPNLQAGEHVTALAGQALTLDGKPLDSVTLRIGENSAQTDSTGRFLLPSIQAGHQVLIIDGRTASRNKKTYGIFRVGVDIKDGKTNPLGYTVWMPKLDTAHGVAISSPTTKAMSITNPRLPGLELRLPPGTAIRDIDGQAVNRISITPIPTNQPPFPLPPNVDVPIYFTIQPGGSQVIPPRAQLIYPNFLGSRPATRIDFYNYDPTEKGWYIYGQGTVTPDGKQIVPDAGVTLYEFSGAMVAAPSLAPSTWPRYGTRNTGGFGVDLSTGLFVLSETDLFEPGFGWISLTRTYRPGDTLSRSFGIGSSHLYDIFLVGSTFPYTYMNVIMPDGSRIFFGRISPGTGWSDAIFEYQGPDSCFSGARISWNGGGWNLNLLNGSLYTFPEAFGASRPMQSALIGIRDRFGNSYTLVRNSLADLTGITSPRGRWVQFEYDSNHRITQARDNVGRAVNYSYDGSGRLSQVTDPQGGIRAYTYDTLHRMTEVRNAMGVTFPINEYDSAGRVTRQTLADNTPTVLTDNPTYQFAYTLDSGGRITQTNVTDPLGNVRRTTFNADGHVLSETAALGEPEEQTVTYQLEATTNRVLNAIDSLGRRISYARDNLGRLTEVTTLAGTSEAVTAHYTYTQSCSCGAVASITDSSNRSLTYEYNQNGSLTGATDQLNNTTTYGYNSFGQMVSVTDTLNNTTQFAYENGDLAAVTDPNGQTTTAFNDAAGRLLSFRTPLGQGFRYEYDAFNRPTRATDTLGGVTEFTYDSEGNLLTLKDARGKVTTYTYDEMSQLLSRTDPLQRVESFEYDDGGNLSKITDRRGKVTHFIYDSLNRIIFAGVGMTVEGGNTSYESTISYSYDSADRLVQVTDSVSGIITYDFDSFDRMISKTTPQGTISYTYDQAGRRSSMTVAGQAPVNYTYDTGDRLTQIAKGTMSVNFAYDNAGRLTSASWGNEIVVEYGYDQRSNLTSMTFKKGTTLLGDLTYTYDPDGRRIKMGGSFARVGMPQVLNSATYDGANQLTQRDGANLTYDGNGNLTSFDSKTLNWNARNQLSSISGPGLTASFQYDSGGNRVGKTINGSTTNYLYDIVDAVQELSGTTPSANVLSGGVDNVLSRSDASGTRTPLVDSSGSTLALADDAGTLRTEYTYDPFGNTITSGEANSNPSKYTGRDEDETGLYYYRARYYSPKLQRFISEDPVGLEGGDVNLYAYVKNDPINYQDPQGLWPTREIRYRGGRVVGGEIHQNSVRRVLGNILSPERLGWLTQALYDADWGPGAQKVSNAYRHAMTPRFDTAANARRKANSWVRNHLVAAQGAASRGDWRAAMTSLGFAMHTMQDATSPAHFNFRTYHGGVIEMGLHIQEENFDPGPGSWLDYATLLAWRYFIRTLPMPDDFFSDLCTDRPR